MSRPTAISPEEQEQIARRIGVLLLQAAPEDWQQITVEYRATGEYHDLLGEVAAQDGSSTPWEPPEDLLGIFEHLREGMYRSDVGTWLSALYVVERPSSYRIDINFDSEPQWHRPLPRAAYIDELRRYPRAEENVPEWMREKVGGSANQPANASSVTPQDATPPEITSPPPAPEEPVSAPPGPATTSAFDAQEYGTEPTPPGTVSFRTAALFDDADDQGRPLVGERTPVQADDSAALRQYLENAPIVLASRDNETDQLDPEQRSTVPATWHTDGTWLWQGAVAYYLAQYGVPPETELVTHARNHRFVLPEIDDPTRDAAVRELMERRGQPGPGLVHTSPQDAVQIGPAGNETAGDYDVDLGDPPGHDDDLAGETTLAGQQGLTVPDGSTPDPVADDVPIPAPHQSTSSEDDPPADPSVRLESGMTEEPWRTELDSPAEPAPDSQSGLDEERGAGESSPETVLAQLHDKLAAYRVDGDSYRIGSHTTGARCLVQEGPDWIVTPSPEDRSEEDVRFATPKQAAAYLLGSLLFSRTADEPAKMAAPAATAPESAPEASQPDLPVASELPERAPTAPEAPDVPETPAAAPQAFQPDAPAANGLPQRTPAPPEASQPDLPAANGLPQRTPAPPEDTQSGGHFLFTANQESASADNPATPPEPPATARPTLERTAQEPPAPAPQAPEPAAPEAQQNPSGRGQPGEEATRFQPAPRPDQMPQPPSATPSPPPPGRTENARPAEQGPPVPNGPQGPPPLPKRPPRPDQGGGIPPAEQNGRPPMGGPPQPAPGQTNGAQTNGAERRPAPGGPPAGPPRQGPAPGDPQAGMRPPQGGPGDPNARPPQAAGQPQPPAGRDQQIQPLRGEPPLTLYRDRHNAVLQPGTDLDRFGDPSGNVTYAIRTPYSQRSLPPQWSSRTYLAYRVQRPVQVLRGTAVPWFEQPGGGTAYVLPSAISDLVADGTLLELAGADAPPRPPMD